ncbi:uL15 family ribosomal protein, partial [Neisseria gonorrhoeae]
VKVIASGEISKAVALKGIKVTKGARAAIEDVGGKIEM